MYKSPKPNGPLVNIQLNKDHLHVAPQALQQAMSSQPNTCLHPNLHSTMPGLRDVLQPHTWQPPAKPPQRPCTAFSSDLAAAVGW